MNVVSLCPLRVSSLCWQPRLGTHALTVVCKATFRLQPDESPLASEQQPPWEADVHVNDDPRRSVRAASDMVPFKRRADVFVVGHAHAPEGRPVMSLVARVVVGWFDKAIEVHVDRAWAAGGHIAAGKPFVRMPLEWERAARGATNPAGLAAGEPGDSSALRRIPNLLPPGFVLRAPRDAIPALGFGAIASHWPSRLALLGRHAAAWDHGSWNTRPLPEDIDSAFFNAAPADQQLAELRGDEAIVLENLHPVHAELTTRLVKIAPLATAHRENGQVQDVRLCCDTLCIDSDRGLAMLVWRGTLLLAHPAEEGVVAVSAEGIAPAGGAEGLQSTAVLQHRRAPAPVLPFAAPAASASADDGTGTRMAGLAPAGDAASKPVLPFAAAPPTWVADKPQPHGARTQDLLPMDAPPPPRMDPPAAVERHIADKPALERESAPPPAELTVEQVATVAAEIAQAQVERTRVLEAHGLTEQRFRANERRCMAAIEAQSARGTHTLRAAYDAAYVARVEAFRGPITLQEYACIVAATERGRANQVLEALGIQQPALMPITRLWTNKVAKDMALADAARQALRAARGA